LSVAVGVFTLVCISIERYIAICRPLLILKLQSLPLGSLMNGLILVGIWIIGILTALPNIYMYEYKPLKTVGKHKCEKSPKKFSDKSYMLSLLILYFLIPMIVIRDPYDIVVIFCHSILASYQSKTRSSSSTPPQPSPLFYTSTHGDICPANAQTYSSENLPLAGNIKSSAVCYNVNHDLRRLSSKTSNQSNNSRSDDEVYCNGNVNCNNNVDFVSSSWPKNMGNTDIKIPLSIIEQKSKQQFNRIRTTSHPGFRSSSKDSTNNHHRREHHKKSSSSKFHRFLDTLRRSSSSQAYRLDKNRRKALKILIAIILEFFICWTPLFIFHTIGAFQKSIYKQVPTVVVNIILIFSFASATCNPFTYYFMSKRYRLALYEYITCRLYFANVKKKNSQRLPLPLQQHNQQFKNIVQQHQKENGCNNRKMITVTERQDRIRANTLH
ncbi:unnamed protein product, partial [Didymodactylos carnosus]